MNASTYRMRMVQALVLAMAAAGTAASAAEASVGRPPDVRDTAAAVNAAVPHGSDRISRYRTSSGFVTRPPDVADAAAAASAASPDAIERYAAAHPHGRGLSSPTGSTVVGRPPDISDAAEAARAVSVTSSAGFHWGDFGAGVGTGIGSIVLLVGCWMVRPLLRRQRAQTA
jgi:hypothetical protein